MNDLPNVLVNLKKQKVVIIQPGGNWGDHLIWRGFENLADQLRLNWHSKTVEEFDPDSVLPEDAIYIQGSGGFTNLASGRALLALKLALRSPSKRIIYGPCTIDDHEQAEKITALGLHKLPPGKLTFFVRENTSYKLAHSVFPSNVDLRINHDTAFYCDIYELLESSTLRRARFTLFAVRHDREAIPDGKRPPPYGVCLDPAHYARSFDHWIRLHARAEKVVTNRTHSAIFSSLLGKETYMFEGAYHKNKSIWEYSLKDRGVHWLSKGDAPSCKWMFPILHYAPHVKIRESYKIGQLMRFLYGVPTR